MAIVFGLAYVPHAFKVAAVTMKFAKEGKRMSFANSRAEGTQAADLTPEGKQIASLTGCHYNGLEAFSYFSAAVLSAVVTKVPTEIIEAAAATFVAVRIGYMTVYLSPLNGPLRSLVFSIGVWISADLFLRAADQYAKGI